jgi:DinB superfamily
VTEREELLERFASFPSRLAGAARAADGRAVPAREWACAEVVSHLIAVEDVVWRARLRDLEATDDPRWTRTEPGLADGFGESSVDDVLTAFAAARAGTVAIVRALDDAGWARVGTHSVYGRLDVAGLLRVAVDHDEEHLASL